MPSQRFRICIKKPEVHKKRRGFKKLIVEKKVTEKHLEMSILK